MSQRPTPREFLEAIYLNNELPLSVRMKAAIECAPYVHPKLAVVATSSMSGDFTERIERGIARSRAAYPKQIELKAEPADE
jgi:hypothetical protein